MRHRIDLTSQWTVIYSQTEYNADYKKLSVTNRGTVEPRKNGCPGTDKFCLL